MENVAKHQDTVAPPERSEVLSAYESATLSMARFTLAVQVFGLMAAVASVIFFGFQLREQVKATRAQVEATNAQVAAIGAQYDSLEASAYQDLMTKALDVDKLLIDKPSISHYIYGKLGYAEKGIPADAYAAASYYLDFYQLVWAQRSRILALKDDSNPDWITWKNSMAATFRESKFLCDHLSEMKTMYSSDFVDFVFRDNNWCQH
ncbi:hypothetical protein R70006_04939 [Paraburkholderia domus]|uniref:hypothetical protein n=1 Tax=Paraburkholderia domus TaxID=2793075 RepID=UPI001913D904|nr:hypothetical protein [Paraburkholderia domus]MBK5051823.1 hypothetical protein [Burkholderia sp. R-70006]CAE6793085.1 hypothetical protein R70006_04939 [Paraburkholderia domus]